MPVLPMRASFASKFEQEVMEMIAHTPAARQATAASTLLQRWAGVRDMCIVLEGCAAQRGRRLVSLYGKGDKTRVVKVSKGTWQALQSHRQDALAEAPVFVSQKGGHLDASQVRRIVLVAAKRIGIEGNVSPHWLRHSHASHALDCKNLVSDGKAASVLKEGLPQIEAGLIAEA